MEQVGLKVVWCRWVLANTVSCTCPLSRGVTTVFERGACGMMFLILSGSLLGYNRGCFLAPPGYHKGQINFNTRAVCPLVFSP